jgi:hypothetical protein
MTSYGRQDINECIEHLTNALGYPLSGGKDRNRKYCHLLLAAMAKAYPDRPSSTSVKLLIKHGMSGYWAKNIDGFQWLYYNYGKIINEIRSKQKKNPGAAGAATVIASVDDRD